MKKTYAIAMMAALIALMLVSTVSAGGSAPTLWSLSFKASPTKTTTACVKHIEMIVPATCSVIHSLINNLNAGLVGGHYSARPFWVD